MADPTPPRLPHGAESYWRELAADDRVFQFTNREVRLLFGEIDVLRAELKEAQVEFVAARLAQQEAERQLKSVHADQDFARAWRTRIADRLGVPLPQAEGRVWQAIEKALDDRTAAESRLTEAQEENVRLKAALAVAQRRESEDEDILLTLAEEKAATTKKPEGGHGTPQSS